MYMYIYIYIHIHTYTYIHVFIYTYVYVCVCVYLYKKNLYCLLGLQLSWLSPISINIAVESLTCMVDTGASKGVAKS